ncbi:MAG: DUF3037 domain-containing protein [Flavobacteriaceae bacterium]|nr:DUF3037 domain-containing protein [Flavobacteriaceae bacterium]
MPRFILNDESVMNSYGFRIKTLGIDLKRFKSNPVMLDGHNHSNHSVIGKWKDIKVENGKLSADTDFDLEDDNAKTISGKVERGIIKGASMGISFSKKDFSYENGELILQKCSLHEASIVAIPSNSGALRLTMDGEELSETDIKTICLSIAQNNEEFKPKSNKKMLKLSQLAFIALGFPSQTKEASEEQVNAAVLALEKDNKDLQAKLTLSEEKVNAFVQKEKEAKLSATTKMIDEAIACGKITADKRQTFTDLAAQNFDLAKSTLDSIPAKQSFSAGITTPAGTGGVATMEDFQKLSLDEQLAFKNSNPEAYKQLTSSI